MKRRGKNWSSTHAPYSRHIRYFIIFVRFTTARQRICWHWISLYCPPSPPTALAPWTWDLTIQGSPAPVLWTGEWHLVAITGDLFKLIHFRTRPTHWCWYLVAIEAHMARPSARYTSYWNAFLLLTIVLNHIMKSQAVVVVKPDILLSAYYLQMTEMSTDHVH